MPAPFPTTAAFACFAYIELPCWQWQPTTRYTSRLLPQLLISAPLLQSLLLSSSHSQYSPTERLEAAPESQSLLFA